MAVLASLHGAAPVARGSIVMRFTRRIGNEFAALAAHGWDAAAQLAVFLWMALVVALFGIVAAGFLFA
jgi:hypothetical protein